jgi:hypothetical protein
VADVKYLLALSTFFQVNEDTRASTSNTMVRQSSKKSGLAAGGPAGPQGTKPGVMIVRLLINEPDIALVEDMDDIDSNAIIVNVRIYLLLVHISIQFYTQKKSPIQRVLDY